MSPCAVAVDVISQSPHDHQPRQWYTVQRVAEPVQQEPDSLVVLQIPDVHSDRIVSTHAEAQQRIGTLSVGRVPPCWSQESSVLYPADGLSRSMTQSDILESRANREHSQALPHSQSFESPQSRKGKLKAWVSVDQLFRER
jgi:hypothetical protein